MHVFFVDRPTRKGARWTWDGNVDAPTFSPSMVVSTGAYVDEGVTFPAERCHYFLRSGRIETTMRSIIATLALALTLAGCSTTQQTKVQEAAATTSGPIVAAMIEAKAGAVAPIAIIATGQAKAYVDATCAAAGGVPVSPPINPAAAPQVAVVVPRTSGA